MSFFRTLLWWLLLAAFGALAFELLSPDLGEVLIRWHGVTVTSTVAFVLVAWALLWFACWMLWTLLRLPFTAWQRMAQTQARNRLVNGLVALHEGRNARAESLLDKAAEDRASAPVARIAARLAALRRGDLIAAASQQAALTRDDPMAAALNNAELLLEQGKPALALEALQPWVERKAAPPRALLMRGEALVGAGRAREAPALIAALALEHSVSAERLAEIERDWQSAALRQAAHADELQQRWAELPAALREHERVLAAYAERAGRLGLETEAATALADAIDQRWNENLVREFGRLPPARDDRRLARAETWLPEHPTSDALALCLGQLCRAAGRLGPAEEVLHRAIALGAGADAWEELGKVFTARNDPERAQASYANALRSLRGDSVPSLSGRSLREQIADEALAERRDEYGMPQLRP